MHSLLSPVRNRQEPHHRHAANVWTNRPCKLSQFESQMNQRLLYHHMPYFENFYESNRPYFIYDRVNVESKEKYL